MKWTESLDRTVADQLGLVTRQQLLQAGWSRHQVDRAVKRGRLITVRRGLYRIPGTRSSWGQAAVAATIAAGHDAVCSHASAARVWDLRGLWHQEDPFEVTMRCASLPALEGVWVHRTRINLDDSRVRDGVPVTSPARTLVDLCDRFGVSQLGRALDDAQRRGLVSVQDVEDVAALFGSGGATRHLTRISKLVGERGPDFDPGGSSGELKLLRWFREAGLPSPVQQHRIRLQNATYFFDYAWPAKLVAVEWDPFSTHGSFTAFHDDRRRLARATAAGWHVLTFTPRMDQREIVELTAQALGLIVAR